MEDNDVINLWKSYDKKLEETLSLNRKNVTDITKIKVGSLISSMRPIKIFTLLVGIIWVILVDVLIIKLYPVASPFFLISATVQVVLTKIAVGVYIYQLILIRQIDIDASILSTQKRLAGLQASTIWITRLLFLQLPVWTTFFWSRRMFETGNTFLYALPIVITLGFTAAALWLFLNIKIENRDKKWFRLIFDGKEWSPVLKSMDLLKEIREYQNEKPVA